MLLTALLLAALDGSAPMRSPRLVDQKQFECLVQHIDTLVSRSEAVTVDISRCPPVIVKRFTSWPTVRVAPVLRLTSAELRCIGANRRHIQRIVDERERGTYELRLDRCGSM